MKSACRKAFLLAILPFALTACFKTSTEIGKDLIDQSLLYDTYTVEFPIEEIRLRRANDLSGFSDSRIAIGAIRDDTFGLTTRSSAFCLVPALDTLDLGTDPESSVSSSTSRPTASRRPPRDRSTSSRTCSSTP